MGDHFVLLVDRLLTESTLEAAIASRNQSTAGSPDSASMVDLETDLPPKKRAGDGISAEKLVQCRICHDEDEDSNMEIPCSCAGSLKYAHRRCVQRWCNEKGDITCEICLQQFKPGYTAPPKLFLYGSIPMNFRGNWEVSQRDIHNHRYITMTPSDRDIAGPDYRDYSASNTRSIMYCRLITLVFMVLLILRHTLPIIMNGAEQNSLPVLAVSLTLLLLRTVGIILPLYIMLRAVTTFHRRRQQQQQQMTGFEVCIKWLLDVDTRQRWKGRNFITREKSNPKNLALFIKLLLEWIAPRIQKLTGSSAPF